jgi:hypothetical protein
MRKILVPLVAVLGFCVVPSAHAGIGFGIPLPFPFLVWTPSSQRSKGSCGPRDQDRTTAIPKSAITHMRAAT